MIKSNNNHPSNIFIISLEVIVHVKKSFVISAFSPRNASSARTRVSLNTTSHPAFNSNRRIVIVRIPPFLLDSGQTMLPQPLVTKDVLSGWLAPRRALFSSPFSPLHRSSSACVEYLFHVSRYIPTSLLVFSSFLAVIHHLHV